MKLKRELLFYFLSFILAIWGIGNVFYFEIYLFGEFDYGCPSCY